MRHFNLWFNKRINTTTKQIPSIVFNTVKNIFDLVKIETEKTRKKFLEDRPFKEEVKVLCLSRIEEAEGRKNLYHLVSKLKNQRHQI